MLGLTSWSMLVPFKTRFVVSSFGKVLKIAGFQRFGRLVEPYFFSVLFYTHTYFFGPNSFPKSCTERQFVLTKCMASRLVILMTATTPLARPPIIVGASLVLMEVLADYGTVSFFEINTLRQGVFDLWLNMNDLAAASQLSLIILLFVFCNSQIKTMETQNSEILFTDIG